MLSFLKDHPFAVEAHFDKSIVLTYAIPKEELKLLIPSCLSLDTFNDKWAFLAVAIVKTNDLRIKGFPRFMGNDFLLIGYRIFVRYTNNRGKNLRGLYILKSETDNAKMEKRGKLFTHYNYHKVNIGIEERGNTIQINSTTNKFNVIVDTSSFNSEICLPKNSPFSTWKEARRYAGPLPFTFTYKPKNNEVVIVEGVRQNWTPSPITVQQADIPFINSLGLNSVVLANAFIINDVPYYWKKGKIEKWET